MMSPEQIIRVNDVDLCAQTFGDRADPALLLLAGAGSSMLSWTDEFCERLAAGRRFVIRFDWRDTGRSATYPPGAAGYTAADLAADAVGVLDAFGVERAHVVGLSMGGGFAQLIALDQPERVASLVLMSTSPGPFDPELPPMSPALLEFYLAEHHVDWADRDSVTAYLADHARRLASPARRFDLAAARAAAAKEFDRATNIESVNNHPPRSDGPSRTDELAGITAPTLVLHGTDDPLFPFPHGEALAKAIPGARLQAVERTGHELPPESTWDQVIPAILDHCAPSSS